MMMLNSKTKNVAKIVAAASSSLFFSLPPITQLHGVEDGLLATETVRDALRSNAFGANAFAVFKNTATQMANVALSTLPVRFGGHFLRTKLLQLGANISDEAVQVKNRRLVKDGKAVQWADLNGATRDRLVGELVADSKLYFSIDPALFSATVYHVAAGNNKSAVDALIQVVKKARASSFKISNVGFLFLRLAETIEQMVKPGEKVSACIMKNIEILLAASKFDSTITKGVMDNMLQPWLRNVEETQKKEIFHLFERTIPSDKTTVLS